MKHACREYRITAPRRRVKINNTGMVKVELPMWPFVIALIIIFCSFYF